MSNVEHCNGTCLREFGTDSFNFVAHHEGQGPSVPQLAHHIVERDRLVRQVGHTHRVPSSAQLFNARLALLVQVDSECTYDHGSEDSSMTTIVKVLTLGSHGRAKGMHCRNFILKGHDVDIADSYVSRQQ